MIRRRCTERNCKNGRKCLEHLRFDLMFRGKRYRIPVNEFVIPRMEAGKQRPIQSMFSRVQATVRSRPSRRDVWATKPNSAVDFAGSP